jgi:DNA polymerase-1
MRTAYIDLETASADALFTYGSGYVRLAGAAVDDGEHVAVTTDCRKLAVLLERADRIVGHNIIKFDLMALARHCGVDYEAVCAKAHDTVVQARVMDPPGSRHQKPWSEKGYYSLDAVAARLGVAGKTDHIDDLAAKWGGYDRIPVDDADYRAYLRGDVRATRAVERALGPLTDYMRREMRVAHLQNRMTLSGWAVDEQLLKDRVAVEEKRQADAVAYLASEGLPLGRSVMRGRGAAKAEVWEPHTSPLSTNEGKEWMARVWERFGVVRPPRTAPSRDHPNGQLALGKDKLAVVRQHPKCPEQLARILDAVADFTGASAKYAEVSKFVTGGRVHAAIGSEEATDQASGRWAMTKPSLTNLGKRGGKVVQRAVFTADEGDVLIACDLDQVDMRAIAAHCQDPAYLQLFGPGADAHSMIADRVFGRHDGEWREKAKKIGHGWNYGMGVQGQIRNGVEEKLARQFDAQMTEQFPVLCAWRDEVRGRATAGELLDNGFGRLMRCDEGRAHTQAPALMGQGTARDLMTTAMLRLADAVPESVRWFRGVVHDEVVLSVPQDSWGEIGREVVKAFTFEWQGVAITAGLSKPGTDWAACYAK